MRTDIIIISGAVAFILSNRYFLSISQLEDQSERRYYIVNSGIGRKIVRCLSEYHSVTAMDNITSVFCCIKYVVFTLFNIVIVYLGIVIVRNHYYETAVVGIAEIT